jgi:neprosin-like protein
MTTKSTRSIGHSQALRNPDQRRRVPHRKPRRKVAALTRDERRELVEHFEAHHAKLKIVKTTRAKSGHTLDWVDISSQYPGHDIASPPPTPRISTRRQRGRAARMAQFELQEVGAKLGPEGTVPIFRTDVRKLRFNKSLNDFLSKHGRALTGHADAGQGLAQPETGGPHDYGATAQTINCLGGEGLISLFDPYTAHSDEFSLSQIGLEGNRDRGGKQTVEAGWQEFRDKYGDWIPHLFVFYTTNGYTKQGDNIGGYNQEVKGWVQYSRSVYPGATSSHVSTPGGQQWELFIKYQLYQGNWWLNVGGEWIGYYPASLFSNPGLRDGADRILFFGEIVDSASHVDATQTQMGTGYFAEYRWPFAAYQRLLRYQTNANGAMADYNGAAIITDSKEDDAELHMNSGTDWRSYFWFGGPGAP